MASELYNIIEGVSREKGIDPQIVVSAVEDAIVVATRKYYKTQENLRAVLDKESGKISAYAVKSIVENPEQVEDPNLQVTVEQARKLDPSAEAGGELLIPKVTEGILGRIAAQLAKQVAALPRLKLRGLMAVPEPTPDEALQRARFAQLRELRDRLNRDGFAMDTLSMGMSADLEAAIAEGATLVRVGTAIFGERQD